MQCLKKDKGHDTENDKILGGFKSQSREANDSQTSSL